MTAEELFNAGVDYYYEGNYDNAIEAFRQATELNSRYAAPHNGLGIVYNQTGDYFLAQKHYNRFVFSEPRQDFVLASLRHTIPFFQRHTDAPYVLKAIFERFPYLDHLESYHPAIIECRQQCPTIDAYLNYRRYITNKTGEDHGYMMALANYYMGHVAEAYRLYDTVLDRDYALNLMGQFYYLSSWADFLEPGLDDALRDALKKKVVLFVQQFNRAVGDVSELYYAGQIYFWAWEQFRESDYLQTADTLFKQADYFVPAQYMRVLTLQALGDTEGMVRQIDKVRKEKEQTYRNGFRKRPLNPDKPALPQLQRYAHFREIQAALFTKLMN